ncbi:MAG TPA: UDP-2,3-diacylglucosamine diphosphatase [Saprospiraceae bacterium]|nr:UDP-2,3-diacylglucosamine diphosphatase [Saprospiraceae bacterium]HNT20368.1 UDP-2,3-diacylglucosamine diphosphatase [Saprospiraceae bacterium]
MRNKIFFCSDFHLGLDAAETSSVREKMILEWMEKNEPEMEALFILGDIFDFWFEYKQVVPRGGIRIMAALARLRDRGIPVQVFTGNHDQWMFGYFQEELDIPVHHDPVSFTLQNKKVMLGHGDGLGPGDHGYKFIKKVFRHPVARTLFGWIPPGMGIPLARYWSGASRRKGAREHAFLGPENEWLIQYCEKTVHKEPGNTDYFIFGHRHLPVYWRLGDGSHYINLGDWLRYHSYAVMEEGIIRLDFYRQEGSKPISNF